MSKQLEKARLKVSDIDISALAKPIRRRFSVRTPAGGRSETWVNVVHEVDPREDLLKKVGKIPEGLVMFSRILVAVYIPPIVEKTSGGILMAQTIQESDRLENYWQGKCGVCVALGPDAYKDDPDGGVKFNGQKIEVGDWVWFRCSDGLACDVNEQFCRLFDSERYIFGKLPHPDFVA